MLVSREAIEQPITTAALQGFLATATRWMGLVPRTPGRSSAKAIVMANDGTASFITRPVGTAHVFASQGCCTVQQGPGKHVMPVGVVARGTGVHGVAIFIERVDVLNETPLIDIKPYIPEFDKPVAAKTGWYEKVVGQVESKRSDKRFE